MAAAPRRAGQLGRDPVGSWSPLLWLSSVDCRKATALLHALARNHGFIDGNKRTALLGTLLMIERSGYALAFHPEERVDDIVVGVANGGINFDELVAWFVARLAEF